MLAMQFYKPIAKNAMPNFHMFFDMYGTKSTHIMTYDTSPNHLRYAWITFTKHRMSFVYLPVIAITCLDRQQADILMDAKWTDVYLLSKF